MKKVNVLGINRGGTKSINTYQLTVPTTEVGALILYLIFKIFPAYKLDK